MSFKNKVNQGSAFRNDRKFNDKSPDFKGDANIAGIEYNVSIWSNPAQGEKKGYFSMKFTQKENLPND